MDDRVKQDEYRRSLTVDDDTSGGFGSDLLLFLFSLLFFSVGLILSRSLCFTSLSLSFSPSSSLVPVSCVLGGAGEGRDG